MPERLRDRLQARLDALGINPFEAARRAGVERSYVNDLLIGKKGSMRPKQLAMVAEALDCDPDFLVGLQGVPRAGGLPGAGMPIAGTVEAGAWREPDADDASGRLLPLVPDPRYPSDRQSWFLVRGDHAAGMGITDGSVLISVEGVAVRDGEPVVIRRRRKSGEIETTVRLKHPQGYATPPSGPWHSPTLGLDEAELVGLVVMAFRTFGS